MVQNQSYIFLVFTLTGIFIGFLYDFFRILRKNIKTSNIITYIEDILFWIITGILILYNIWFFNNGEIRLFMFLGIILGILIYISTLSSIIIKLFSKILIIAINIARFPIKKLKFPKKLHIKKGNIVNNGE